MKITIKNAHNAHEGRRAYNAAHSFQAHHSGAGRAIIVREHVDAETHARWLFTRHGNGNATATRMATDPDWHCLTCENDNGSPMRVAADPCPHCGGECSQF